MSKESKFEARNEVVVVAGSSRAESRQQLFEVYLHTQFEQAAKDSRGEGIVDSIIPGKSKVYHKINKFKTYLCARATMYKGRTAAVATRSANRALVP